jgi:hypothetical protein
MVGVLFDVEKEDSGVALDFVKAGRFRIRLDESLHGAG